MAMQTRVLQSFGGMRQDKAAGRAVAAASLSVTRRGVMDALPRREEFEGPGVSAVYDKEE